MNCFFFFSPPFIFWGLCIDYIGDASLTKRLSSPLFSICHHPLYRTRFTAIEIALKSRSLIFPTRVDVYKLAVPFWIFIKTKKKNKSGSLQVPFIFWNCSTDWRTKWGENKKICLTWTSFVCWCKYNDDGGGGGKKFKKKRAF